MPRLSRSEKKKEEESAGIGEKKRERAERERLKLLLPWGHPLFITKVLGDPRLGLLEAAPRLGMHAPRRRRRPATAAAATTKVTSGASASGSRHPSRRLGLAVASNGIADGDEREAANTTDNQNWPRASAASRALFGPRVPGGAKNPRRPRAICRAMSAGEEGQQEWPKPKRQQRRRRWRRRPSFF